MFWLKSRFKNAINTETDSPLLAFNLTVAHRGDMALQPVENEKGVKGEWLRRSDQLKTRPRCRIRCQGTVTIDDGPLNYATLDISVSARAQGTIEALFGNFVFFRIWVGGGVRRSLSKGTRSPSSAYLPKVAVVFSSLLNVNTYGKLRSSGYTQFSAQPPLADYSCC
ncbi:hypothetical protein M413DRAFT_448776 [Hebeloma cylindrosporum]|uniref:Uncharacterized protein n=1 Tax=Hebeloma cylindrosporum TaxID=76867 RepID=A0A0C2Y7R1_HEBCY|nr:hypothetical protein M413DRAFT_448776 [Hebeloma cylindrosporum h7]